MNDEQTATLLRREDVLRRVGISKTTLYDMIAAGRFPRPVRVSPARVGWVESEVDAWIAERISARNLGGAR